MSTRGAVERVGDNFVSGWISSSAHSLKEATVLAFRGRECIGSAKIEGFRQDIADAKLGDGYSGFVIHTMPIAKPDQERIYVRLEGDDAILVTPGYHEKPTAFAAAGPELTLERLNDRLRSIRWMRDRDWITPAQADLLRALLRYGVYELRIEASGGESNTLEDVRRSLATLLGLIHRRQVAIEVQLCATPEALTETLEEQEKGDDCYVGLWSATRNRVEVAEGSHVAHAQQQTAHLAGVMYEFGVSQVLVLDPRVSLIVPNSVSQTLLLRAGSVRDDDA